jgi:hypothetical protein
VDALPVIHCPTAVETGEGIAKAVVDALENRGVATKPVIACALAATMNQKISLISIS